MLDGCELTKALLAVAELSADADADADSDTDASEAMYEPPASLAALGPALLVLGLESTELSDAGSEE